jgi:hypothetical protein
MKTQEWIISKAVSTGCPALLWGEPGVGKTARLAAFAAEAGFHFFPVVLSHYDPVEFHGVLSVDPESRRVHRALPDWAGPQVFDPEADSLIFLDELSTSTPAQQAAALKLLSERELGGRKLSPRCRIVAAANPPECAAGGQDLAAPTANRFAHVRMGADADDFSAHFASMWADTGSGLSLLPAPSADDQIRARALIAAFIKRRPNLLHAMPADPAGQSGPWPSPRSWELCARLIAGERDNERILAAAAATVGEAAATELAAFMRECELPDPEEILADPESAPLPERGDILYAAMSAAAAAAIARPSRDRVRAVWVYLRRAAEAGHADVAAPVIRPLLQGTGSVFSPVSEPALLAPFRRVLDAAK